MNKKNKDILENKIRNKEQIKNTKLRIKRERAELKLRIKHSKAEEASFRKQARRRNIEEKNKLRKKEILFEKEIKSELQVLSENKKLIADQKKLIEDRIKMQKQLYKSRKNESKSALWRQKQEIKNQLKIKKIESSAKLAEISKQEQNRNNQLRLKIQKQKNETQNFVAEAKKVILEKEKEIKLKENYLIQKARRKNLDKKRGRENQKLKKKLEREVLKKQKLHSKMRFKNNQLDNRKEDIEKLENLKKAILDLKENNKELSQENKEKIVKYQIEINNLEKSLNQLSDKKLYDEKEKQKQEIEDTMSFVTKIEDYEVEGIDITSNNSKEIKLFKDFSKTENKFDLNKAKINKEIINRVLLFQKLKRQDQVVDISDFIDYIGFMIGRDIEANTAKQAIISIMYQINRGRVFEFLGGYIEMNIVNGYRIFNFTKEVNMGADIFSLPKNDFGKSFNEIIKNKISKGMTVKLFNNLGIKKINNEIHILHDVGILR